MEILRAGWNILALAITTRPFRFKRFKRAFNLILFLRHYEHRGLVILLDQGIVQKIWSILADANAHSNNRLHGSWQVSYLLRRVGLCGWKHL